MTVQQMYDESIRQLPPIERLRLATLILDELTATNGAGLDINDAWSPEDIADLTSFSARHASASLGDQDA